MPCYLLKLQGRVITSSRAQVELSAPAGIPGPPFHPWRVPKGTGPATRTSERCEEGPGGCSGAFLPP